MIIIIGLAVLIAAVIIGVAAVVGNTGDVQQFAVFDYQFHDSTGALFGYGIALGAIGMLGLALVLSGAWRVTRRGAVARRELRQSRREMAAVRRDLAAETPEAGARPTSEPAWRRWLHTPARAERGKTASTSKPLTAK
ncbi:hypothetical protein [Nocardia pneumoniae]|uniref:hypothetical protein n=1 Tax=Nocardia pneumoniae TaxID=228601 RepID=UPI0002D35A3E|nr:hypothetical protein [Nocardia pneumoniae]